MRRPCPTEGQRPAKRGMVAEACRHVLLAGVAHVRRHGKRRTVECEADLQFEAKGVDLQSGFVRPQPKGRSGGTGAHDVEKLSPRETMPGKMIGLRTQAITAAGECPNDGK